MSFSQFTKSSVGREEKKEEFSQENIMREYEELKSMNNDQLTSRLFEEVAKQKRDGTFDFNALSQSVESLKNYIPEETYINLKKLLENLR